MANAYPYYDSSLDEMELILAICDGLRPNINELKIPQVCKDLMKKCWNADPNKRPTAKELVENHMELWNNRSSEFWKQLREIEPKNSNLFQNTPYKIKPNTITTSKLIDTRKITELLSSKMSSLDLSKTVLDYYNYQSTELGFDIEMKSTEKDSYRTQELNFDIETSTSTQELTKRFRSLSMEEANQKETKSVKLKKITEELYSEPMEIDNDSSQNWTNIHLSFTSELTQSWTNLNFTCFQTQDWINAGFQPTDYNFCAWLRDNKHLTPEQVLNHENIQTLNQKFFIWWQEQQQTNIEIPPKS